MQTMVLVIIIISTILSIVILALSSYALVYDNKQIISYECTSMDRVVGFKFAFMCNGTERYIDKYPCNDYTCNTTLYNCNENNTDVEDTVAGCFGWVAAAIAGIIVSSAYIVILIMFLIIIYVKEVATYVIYLTS